MNNILFRAIHIFLDAIIYLIVFGLINLIIAFFSLTYGGIAIWPAFLVTKIFTKKVRIKNSFILTSSTIVINTIIGSLLMCAKILLSNPDIHITNYYRTTTGIIAIVGMQLCTFFIVLKIFQFFTKEKLDKNGRIFLAIWSIFIFVAIAYMNNLFELIVSDPNDAITFTLFYMPQMVIAVLCLASFNKYMKYKNKISSK